MVPPVEAQSLSSLTSLFANPPQYPRNPTHEVREPLILYIIRVPASRDVFLTPLKPPTKASVSVEAIQSCLYYCHLITPGDEAVRKSLEERKRSEEADRLANVTPVYRKALPLTPFANYPPTERPPTPLKSYPHFQPPSKDTSSDTQFKRFAARGVHLRFPTSNENREGSVRRKPIGPRPLEPTLSDENATISRKPVGFHHDELVHSSPRNQVLSSLDQNSAISSQTLERPDLPPRRVLATGQDQSCGPDFDCIVLIRRDPSSGGQWNVGTISLRGSNGSAVVEINTPGYQKFAREDVHTGKEETGDTSSKKSDHVEQIPSFDTPASNLPSTKIFRRNIDSMALSNQVKDREIHQRNKSEDILNSLKESLTNPPQGATRLKTVFTSPWGGICSFSTGLDGRSLKCRHSLPHTSSTSETSSENVAEIRSNLPWLRVKQRTRGQTQIEGDFAVRNEPISKQIGLETKQAFRRSVQKFKQGHLSNNLPSASQSMDWSSMYSRKASTVNTHTGNASDDEGRMDLKLGQEKAGGGFKGKSAKLGKVIIEDEGLKMADLLVGALMSVWWQHYEKSLGDS